MSKPTEITPEAMAIIEKLVERDFENKSPSYSVPKHTFLREQTSVITDNYNTVGYLAEKYPELLRSQGWVPTNEINIPSNDDFAASLSREPVSVLMALAMRYCNTAQLSVIHDKLSRRVPKTDTNAGINLAGEVRGGTHRWVRYKEKISIPSQGVIVPIRYNQGKDFELGTKALILELYGNGWEDVEWLEEVPPGELPTQQQSDAIEFADWKSKNIWREAGSIKGSWYKVIDGNMTYKTTTELYKLFKDDKRRNDF